MKCPCGASSPTNQNLADDSSSCAPGDWTAQALVPAVAGPGQRSRVPPPGLPSTCACRGATAGHRSQRGFGGGDTPSPQSWDTAAPGTRCKFVNSNRVLGWVAAGTFLNGCGRSASTPARGPDNGAGTCLSEIGWLFGALGQKMPSWGASISFSAADRQASATAIASSTSSAVIGS